MSNKLTISCEADLADVELEEGLVVMVRDSGNVLKCIASNDGKLLWQTQSSSRYDFPESSPQLQEIEFEDSSRHATKKPMIMHLKTTYLH